MWNNIVKKNRIGMILLIKLCLIVQLCWTVLFFASCSSAPKRPAEIFTIQSMVETNITLANREADHGNFTQALSILDEAWRLAVTTDRPALRIRVNLSRANAHHALGWTAEAERLWQEAEQEANAAGEQVLASVSRIYRARSMLLAGTMNPREVLNLTLREQNILRKDRLFSALNWTVKGIAEKEMGRYADAERSIMNALTIHEKDRYLEQAAYDWYLIASVRSVAGNYAGAIEALDNALGFDRRAENTFGLAMTWTAKGEVYRNMGDEENAAQAWRRSAAIFRAMDRQADAREVEARIRKGRRSNIPRRNPEWEEDWAEEEEAQEGRRWWRRDRENERDNDNES